MSDAGKTCVALMVSAGSAGAAASMPARTAAGEKKRFISPPPVVRTSRGILPSGPVTTVFSAFERTARAHGERPFLQVFPERIELSYARTLDLVGEIAARYRRAGYRAGHRVALRLPNCAEFLPHFLALRSGILPSGPVTTVFSAFERTARAHGERPFLQVFPERIELSYARTLDLVGEIAARYRRAGYRAGHRVALRLPNCAEFLPHFLAL